MPGTLRDGPIDWRLSRDEEGNREYKATFLIETDDHLDGPEVISNTPGLPVPGSWWIIGNDVDLWAWCRQTATIAPVRTKEKNKFWTAEFVFSTKEPEANYQRCNDTSIEDPLMEPQKISGSFIKYTEEATYDMNGRPIINSAWEQLRGPQIEFDKNRPQVKVEQNVADLELPMVTAMVDTVNTSPFWGLPARCIKLSEFSWEQKFYGSCYKYFTRSLTFDINPNTWDRIVLDEGTKVLNGRWGRGGGETQGWMLLDVNGVPPDRLNPNHFIRFTDRQGNLARVILNGRGIPYDPEGDTTGTSDDAPGQILVQKYSESELLLLGIPLEL